MLSSAAVRVVGPARAGSETLRCFGRGLERSRGKGGASQMGAAQRVMAGRKTSSDMRAYFCATCFAGILRIESGSWSRQRGDILRAGLVPCSADPVCKLPCSLHSSRRCSPSRCAACIPWAPSPPFHPPRQEAALLWSSVKLRRKP